MKEKLLSLLFYLLIVVMFRNLSFETYEGIIIVQLAVTVYSLV